MYHPHHAQVTLIFGLGQTGLSCVRYGCQKGLHMRVLDTGMAHCDWMKFQNDFPGIERYIGPVLEADFDTLLKNVKHIIVSPGIYIKEHALLKKAQCQGIPLIGDIELFAQQCQAPYIAITGSNGKTTVTTLVGELVAALGFRVGVGGNIGTPVLDLLTQASPFEVYVLELSSFQLETTYSLKPTVATILNITPDHLDRYESYAAYVRAKQKILENARTIVPQMSLRAPERGSFGVLSHEGETWLGFDENELICPLKALKLEGHHNYINVLSALSLVYALGQSLGLRWTLMKGPFIKVLTTFSGLAHRCQRVQFHQGVTWINDSKGTNIGASLAALESMSKKLDKSGKLIWIAGGEGKNQDFNLLKNAMPPFVNHIQKLVLIGKDARHIDTILNGIVPTVCLKTLTQAVDFAFKQAQPGDIVLLSPSCSSLDQYTSYVARGQDFIQAVNHLTGNP